MSNPEYTYSGDYFKHQLLATVEDAILQLVSGKVSSYAIGSRNITYNNLNDLIALRDKLRSELCGGIQINVATFKGI